MTIWHPDQFMTEDALNQRIRGFWRSIGAQSPAPTLRDLWMQQCRVASDSGLAEPTFEQLAEHFSWFFLEDA